MKLSEEREMYARAMNRKSRYTPPIGYAGTAFGSGYAPDTGNSFDGEMAGKVHEPQENTAELLRRTSYRPEYSEATDGGMRNPDQSRDYLRGESREMRDLGDANLPAESKPGEKSLLAAPLDELLGELRGRIGAEELILLLIMLLCASDGVGIEVILLGLVLMAGKE